MSCVRSVTYSILINGQPHGNIIHFRGVRQDDPLSPYLFVICVEAMSFMFHQAEREGGITGISITWGDTCINHLFLADDSLLFYRANIREWGRIQALLVGYKAALGQKINWEKNLFFFSRNTRPDAIAIILQEAGVSSTQQYEKYLGLLALIGRSRVSTFNGIKGRIWNHINWWKEKFLSHGSKEIFLNWMLIPETNRGIYLYS
jgi:hypothetical protein